jgi:hypothetical protein
MQTMLPPDLINDMPLGGDRPFLVATHFSIMICLPEVSFREDRAALRYG